MYDDSINDHGHESLAVPCEKCPPPPESPRDAARECGCKVYAGLGMVRLDHDPPDLHARLTSLEADSGRWEAEAQMMRAARDVLVRVLDETNGRLHSLEAENAALRDDLQIARNDARNWTAHAQDLERRLPAAEQEAAALREALVQLHDRRIPHRHMSITYPFDDCPNDICVTARRAALSRPGAAKKECVCGKAFVFARANVTPPPCPVHDREKQP